MGVLFTPASSEDDTDLAGHKTIAITARYAHLAPNTLHSAVELVTQIQVKGPELTAHQNCHRPK
jgi:hypothetical protein